MRGRFAVYETLAAARGGQAWACARLYEDLKRPVVAYVGLRGSADPDDMASEVFLCVFRHLERSEGGEADFRAWVFTIAHRRVLDDWRKRSRRPAQTRLDVRSVQMAGGDAQEEAMAELTLRDVDALLSGLTSSNGMWWCCTWWPTCRSSRSPSPPRSHASTGLSRAGHTQPSEVR